MLSKTGRSRNADKIRERMMTDKYANAAFRFKTIYDQVEKLVDPLQLAMTPCAYDKAEGVAVILEYRFESCTGRKLRRLKGEVGILPSRVRSCWGSIRQAGHLPLQV